MIRVSKKGRRDFANARFHLLTLNFDRGRSTMGESVGQQGKCLALSLKYRLYSVVIFI